MLKALRLRFQKIILRRVLPLLFMSFLAHNLSAIEVYLDIEFYGQEISLSYDDELSIVSGVKFSEEEFTQFLKEKENKSFQSLLTQLAAYKKKMNLNDWMYFELMHQSIQKILSNGNDYEKTLFSYFLLAKSGYDSKITFLNHKMWVNVYTQDKLYEISTILLGNKNFVNLTAAIDKKDELANQIYLLEYNIPGANKPFSFEMNALPYLVAKPKDVNINFDFKGKAIDLHVKIDLNLIEVIQNYPIFDEVSYLETPLSPTAIKSLRPQLLKYMDGMNEETQLEFLVSITRMAFNYKEDHEAFGRNKPMIAEELFFYQYSDCEDRCALFYNLNKITLDLPLLVIALPDHLSIAVAMKNQPSHVKNVIKYGQRDYYFCDPTGPFNAHHIGSLPKEYQNSTYEILSTYK